MWTVAEQFLLNDQRLQRLNSEHIVQLVEASKVINFAETRQSLNGITNTKAKFFHDWKELCVAFSRNLESTNIFKAD